MANRSSRTRDSIRKTLGYCSALLLPACLSCVLVAAEPSPAMPPPSAEIDRLIATLGDADYFVRQQAESDLRKIGFDALEALATATRNDDMEVAARASRLLFLIRSNWNVLGELPAVAGLLSEYEAQDDDSREARIIGLIKLAGNQGLPAVCRIIRYERSLPVAKIAAVRLLESKIGEPATPELAAILRKGLTLCRRPPARWILAWLEARQDPRAMTGIWTQLAAEEEYLLFHRPRDTSLPIVEGMFRIQIAALRKIDRGVEAVSGVERLIQLHRGESNELARLLNWLIDQKDWSSTRLVETRCQSTISHSANLLYLLAEAQARRGDAAVAEQSASRALKLVPESDELSLVEHFQSGEGLEQRGHFQWAIREWEHVSQTASSRSPAGISAARRLAELLHDLGEDRRAAETLDRIEKAFASRFNEWTLPGQLGAEAITLGTLRARMFYFDACHWKVRGDRAKQRECLDRALATQSYDIEALIECYQLADAAGDYRATIRRLIEKRLCELREQVADLEPNIAAAQPCNEFAWLVANTEGDLDEALRFSKRSIELLGLYGAYGPYCDTLARVYYAKGDLANAVKQQARAAEMLPHNRAVQNQLALFRKKMEETGEKSGKKDQAMARP
jgi:tetratricopeptide (TPR) repeat protein